MTGPADPGPVLPASVRARVAALAADLLGQLPPEQVPASLRAVSRCTPAKRARLGAGWQERLCGQPRSCGAREGARTGATRTHAVRRLCEQLEALREAARAEADRLRAEAEAARAEAAAVRRRVRELGDRVGRAEAAQRGAEQALAAERAGLAGERAAAEEQLLVLFSREGETADEVLRTLVRREPPGRPVVVVSGDREVADGVRASGAYAVPSRALLRLLGR